MNKLTRQLGIVFIILYFLSPIDLIPDTIPGVGGLDDILVAIVTAAIIGNEKEEEDE